MNEDNNNQPNEKQQPSDEIQPELREISEEELKQILENHKKWLESNGKEGERAVYKKVNLQETSLSTRNLQNIILRESNLQKANLNSAKLQKSYLNGTNFYKAFLNGAQLQQAYLPKTNFQKAHLRKANLQEASLGGANLINADFCNANMQMANLIGAKLRCADLSNANMKKTVLKNVSGIARANLHYANLEGAIGLLGNEFAQADVTGTKLPGDIKEFKALETVEKTSQNARKIFFAMLLGCVYSWLTIATTTDVRLLTNTASSPLPIIQTEIPIAWFYIAAPLVLISLYLYFHFYLQGLWESLASLPAIFPDGKRLDERAYPWLLNRLARRHFKRLKNDRPIMAKLQELIVIILAWCVVPFTMIGFWLRFIPRHDWLGTIFHVGLVVVSIAFAIIFYRLCALSLQGKARTVFRLKDFWSDRRFYYGVSVVFVAVLFSFLSYGAIEGVRPHKELKKIHSIKELVPWIFTMFKYDVFANFRETKASEIPTNYWEINKKERLQSVKGANLKGADLKNANMQGAFMVKANLKGAVLQNAFLLQANLQNANFEGANIQFAWMGEADLQNAILNAANLFQANLPYANLQNASFEKANLMGAIIPYANLQNANLEGSNLQSAYITETNFENANLRNAILIYTDLSKAKNLTIDQLSKVRTLYKAKLNPDLLEQVQKCCPELREKPKNIKIKKFIWKKN